MVGLMGLIPTLTVIFLVLKITGLIAWPWWWVLCPLWIPAALMAAAAALVALAALVL